MFVLHGIFFRVEVPFKAPQHSQMRVGGEWTQKDQKIEMNYELSDHVSESD